MWPIKLAWFHLTKDDYNRERQPAMHVAISIANWVDQKRVCWREFLGAGERSGQVRTTSLWHCSKFESAWINNPFLILLPAPLSYSTPPSLSQSSLICSQTYIVLVHLCFISKQCAKVWSVGQAQIAEMSYSGGSLWGVANPRSICTKSEDGSKAVPCVPNLVASEAWQSFSEGQGAQAEAFHLLLYFLSSLEIDSTWCENV